MTLTTSKASCDANKVRAEIEVIFSQMPSLKNLSFAFIQIIETQERNKYLWLHIFSVLALFLSWSPIFSSLILLLLFLFNLINELWKNDACMIWMAIECVKVKNILGLKKKMEQNPCFTFQLQWTDLGSIWEDCLP